MEKDKPATARLQYLDSLRGLAALGVAYYHFSSYFSDEGLLSSPLDKNLHWLINTPVDLGRLGVALFFIISGFVIPYSLLKRNTKLSALRYFLVSRFFRLYPAYWASALAMLVVLLIQGQPWGTKLFTQFMANLTMFQVYLGVEDLVGLYWTLAIEMLFYIFCIVLFALNIIPKAKNYFWLSLGFLLMSVAVSIFRWWTQSHIPLNPSLALSLMFWGTMFRELTLEGNKSLMLFNRLQLLMFVCLIPIICFFAYGTSSVFEGKEFTPYAWIGHMNAYLLSIGLFILCTQRFKLESGLLTQLGAISYSVYLFHPIVYDLLEIQNIPFQISQFLPAQLSLSAILFIVCLWSYLVYNGLEKPGIEFGRKFLKQLEAREMVTSRAEHKSFASPDITASSIKQVKIQNLTDKVKK